MVREQFNIFIWNCRGATNNVFVRVCKNYIHLVHPDIFVIMETRVDTKKLRRKFYVMGFDGYTYSNVAVYSGSIVMEWKQGKVSIIVEHIHFQFLHTKV